MFDLFVTSDISRRLIEDSLGFDESGPRKAKKRLRRRRGVRSASAAALRGLAERLEASLSA